MPWSLWCIYTTLFVSLIADCIFGAQGVILPPIHWNSSNPMFKSSSNDHVIEVNLYDALDIVCPFYVGENGHIPSSKYEYYIVHEVSEEEYRACMLISDHSQKRKMVVNCSSPKEYKYFSMWFVPFTPIPDVPEFESGETYYFITTSTGSKYGIANDASGACLHKNMKISIKVAEDPTTPTTTPPSSSTTPVITTTSTTTTTTSTTTSTGRPTVHWTSRPKAPTTPTTHRFSTTTKKWKSRDNENSKNKDKLVSSATTQRLSGAVLAVAVALTSLLTGLLSR